MYIPENPGFFQIFPENSGFSRFSQIFPEFSGKNPPKNPGFPLGNALFWLQIHTPSLVVFKFRRVILGCPRNAGPENSVCA